MCQTRSAVPHSGPRSRPYILRLLMNTTYLRSLMDPAGVARFFSTRRLRLRVCSNTGRFRHVQIGFGVSVGGGRERYGVRRVKSGVKVDDRVMPHGWGRFPPRPYPLGNVTTHLLRADRRPCHPESLGPDKDRAARRTSVCVPVVFCTVAAFLASNKSMQPSAHYVHYELTVDMVWGCEASQGITQVSVERELLVKATRECSEVRRGYMEPASWVVASDRKQSRTLQRSAKLCRSGRLGWECVGFELLRPRASAACWGTQGMNLTELPRPSEMRGVDPIRCRAMVSQKTVHGQHSNRLYPFPGTYDFIEVVKGRLKVHYSDLLLSV
ncbi:hypothetical protein EDB86DRAFT_3248946 [Lactarius hatsudake]|nr:hypothetical protein EDB86DRAFT_3248946 [Lactarius hatsudake]